MATLSLESLHKAYGETQVLAGIDLEIADGEYLVLVGPSGCGKSTLLRCIAGLESISSGTLRIGGRLVHDVSPKDRDVAMVFQSYALYPHMTVADNVSFPLRIRRMPAARIAEAVSEAAELLDLTPLLDRYPAQLSGGQRQRVAMGRAIVRRPSVFLFDEPLSNLDASLRSHMRIELKRLHRALAATIVHVTHDQIEALTLADRILVLDRGVVQQLGTPRELFDTPANTFVATFIGSPSMTLLPGEGRTDHCVVQGTALRIPVAHTGPVTLGLRASDVSLVDGDDATIDVVESLGPIARVHVDIGAGHHLIAEAPEPMTRRPGERVGLRWAAVHRFDPDTGDRVGAR